MSIGKLVYYTPDDKIRLVGVITEIQQPLAKWAKLRVVCGSGYSFGEHVEVETKFLNIVGQINDTSA